MFTESSRSQRRPRPIQSQEVWREPTFQGHKPHQSDYYGNDGSGNAEVFRESKPRKSQYNANGSGRKKELEEALNKQHELQKQVVLHFFLFLADWP